MKCQFFSTNTSLPSPNPGARRLRPKWQLDEGSHIFSILFSLLSQFTTFAPMKREIKGNACVFCASSASIDSRYLDAARELGTLLARRGWRCVNGGGAVGLMGAVTDGTLDAGGEVTGVIPKFMVDNGWCYDRLEDVIVTADMHQRKQMMSEMADAVIALPGGVGTLEELLETLTWRQLSLVKVPVIILNTLGYYDPLLAMLGHAINEGFMKPVHSRLWSVASTPLEAIDMLEHAETIEFESKY